MLLTSALLGAVPNLRHGFSTRRGGVSEGPFAGLNLGPKVGDRPEHVAENRRRFLRAIDPERSLSLAEAEQVHGTTVLSAERGGEHATSADALTTRALMVAVAVRTADCAPILAARVEGGRAVEVFAIHAGWRGATAEITAAALSERPEQIHLAIGPTIGLASFEVGPEVTEAAARSLRGAAPPVVIGPRGRPHLDLRRLLVMQLEALGVPAGQIELVGGDTAAEPELYFSHRRDLGRTGRHLSAIALVEPP